MLALSKVFLEKDASLAEINPLAVTKNGDVVVLDAKIDFDDNALFRHKDVAALRDEGEENPAEIRAGKANLNFIQLDGTIGCLVNGAGLAMATMDIIKLPRAAQPGELPRRGRRRDRRGRDRGVPHHPVRPEGEGRSW